MWGELWSGREGKRRELRIPVGISRCSASPSPGWNPVGGEKVPYEPVTRWHKPGESPLGRRARRPAPRVSADGEQGEGTKRSRLPCRAMGRGFGVLGSGGLCESGLAKDSASGRPAGVRYRGLAAAEPRGGPRASKFAAGTTPRRLEQPLVGKPCAGAGWGGGLSAAGSRPAAPRQGCPSLSPGWGGKGQQRGSPGPCAFFPLGLAPSSPPPRVLPILRTDPAVKARGCSVACLPAWRGGEIARRPRRWRLAGRLKGHRLLATPQDLLSQQFAKSSEP